MTASARAIPLLDWQRYAGGGDEDGFVHDLGAACRGPGFFLLSHHGVDHRLIDDVFAAADAFFALPEADKAPLSIMNNPHNRGWTPFGSENLDDGKPETVDRKEAFNIGLDLSPEDPRILAGEPFRGINLWPDLPGFRDVMLRYFEAVLNLGRCLHRPIARDLGLDDLWFEDKLDAPLATLRLLHYPAASGAAGEIGAGAHTDYGSITLLRTDGEAGLQVRPRGGDWIDLPAHPDAFVVNIGDCLMRWTNDLYASTPHRVTPPKRTRRSIAFFLDPNPDAVISALPGTGAAKYPAVTGAEYLRMRLDATYGTVDGAGG
ncbi:MAG: 2-oxoglutarate and iron-dependent oxygenase domain-containing protein [Pseudomonadota bacterium]